MASSAWCFKRIARTSIHRKQWNQLPRRFFATSPDEKPEWFESLRNEMLNRELPLLKSLVDKAQAQKLTNTLSGFLPELSSPDDTPVLGNTCIGDHLVYFNPEIPSDQLLSDGTDTRHSPREGGFVRRMWAGGSVRVNPQFYSTRYGWSFDREKICSERIKDVQLRGQGDTAKLFVTVERRIALYKRIFRSIKVTDEKEIEQYFQKQARKEAGWGDSIVIEQRNLVFMRQRSDTELAAIKEGKAPPIKYISTTWKPDFSHILTPTSSLLFRFSALTFNAHAIHLDREYTRTVEGHRDLLVHGPLTVMLMVKFITSQLASEMTFVSIEYKNLAPLYCNEPLRLCGREKPGKTKDKQVFDVWIEGPTGGVAFKGTVLAAKSSRIQEEKKKRLALEEEKGEQPSIKKEQAEKEIREQASTIKTEGAIIRKIWARGITREIPREIPKGVRVRKIVPRVPKIRKMGQSLKTMAWHKNRIRKIEKWIRKKSGE